jgi:hypothetical protein
VPFPPDPPAFWADYVPASGAKRTGHVELYARGRSLEVRFDRAVEKPARCAEHAYAGRAEQAQVTEISPFKRGVS